MEPSIVIYSTSTCSSCHVLTSWLDKLGKTYTKKITDEDDAAMIEFMSLNDGMVSVPFTVITAADGTVTKVSGYDQSRFKQVLGV